MPVLFLDCHLPHNTPHIPSRYNNEQTTKTNKSYKQLIYIYISHVNVTQTVPDISTLMPMHQDPLLVMITYKHSNEIMLQGQRLIINLRWLATVRLMCFLRFVLNVLVQRTHDVKIKSYLRTDVVTSFWHNNDIFLRHVSAGLLVELI